MTPPKLWLQLGRAPVVLPVHCVLVALVLAGAISRDTGLIRIVIFAAAGFVAWTAFEYAAHRWLLHNTGRLRVIWQRYHLPHHATGKMSDPNHYAVHLWQSLPVVLPIYLSQWLLGADELGAAAAGFGVGYCVYELLHWTHHVTDWSERFPRVRYLGVRAELHVGHHFHCAARNYGFVTSFWDHLFGTYEKPSHSPHRVPPDRPRFQGAEPPASGRTR